MPRLPHFDVVKQTISPRQPEWWFRVVASNGRTLCHSETYRRKRDCMKAIRAVKCACDIKVSE